MRPADGQKFRELLRAMSRVLPCQSGAELDNPMLDVYWLALRDWPLVDFEGACGHLLKTSKFMPRPCDFTELLKADDLTAGEAWALVLEAARGGYECPEDPVIQAAVRAIGGIRAIGMSTRENTPHLERRFCEHFEAISEREEVREALPSIAGPSRARVGGPRSLAEIDFEGLPDA
jgi:hypothetical protein